jgi:hypothetical protein
MIRGWCMELPSEFIRATTMTHGLVVHMSRLAWALASADSGAGLVGVGTRGAVIGEGIVSPSTTIFMFLTVRLSSIVFLVVEVEISREAWTDLLSEGTVGLETVAIGAELSKAATLHFLRVFDVTIRPSLRVFTIAILRSLREPLRTVVTFVASTRLVQTLVLVLAPSAVLVQVEPNKALRLGGMTVLAEAVGLVDEASAGDARLGVEARWVEVVDMAEDATDVECAVQGPRIFDSMRNDERENRTMLRIGNHFERAHVAWLISLSAVVLFVSGSFSLARAQKAGQKTFPSTEEACAALLDAVQQLDQPALVEILGPTAMEIISVGDEAEDVSSRRLFVEKYREMHRLAREANGTTTLYIGPENWPVPILLVRKANGWYFDPEASRTEILVRRIGRNELETIEVCRELVKAQNEFHSLLHDGEAQQFATRFVSDDGLRNGLYWKISEGEPNSPVGQLLTLASFEDAVTKTTGPRPFHGYYFRILTRQGHHATGGAKNYMVNGKMTGGFAFVAYPAEYRSSGVMTFIVSRDGIVYQKDLGPTTAHRAKTLTQYNPDATWKKVE